MALVPGAALALALWAAGAAAQDPKVRGFIGLEIQPLPLDAARALDMQGTGIYVRSIAPGFAADLGGVKPTDVLVRFDGARIYSMPQVVGYAHSATPGQPIVLSVLRHGVPKRLEIVPNAWPKGWVGGNKAIAVSDELGITLQSLSETVPEGMTQRWGAQGAMVTQVVGGGMAAQAGLQVGDIIRSVRMRPLGHPADLEPLVGRALQDSSTAVLVDRLGVMMTLSFGTQLAKPDLLEIPGGRLAALDAHWTDAFGLAENKAWLVLHSDQEGALHGAGLVPADMILGDASGASLNISKVLRRGEALADAGGTITLAGVVEPERPGEPITLAGIRFEPLERAGSPSRMGRGLVVAEANHGWNTGEVLLYLNQTRIETAQQARDVVDAAVAAGRTMVLALVDTRQGHRARLMPLGDRLARAAAPSAVPMLRLD